MTSTIVRDEFIIIAKHSMIRHIRALGYRTCAHMVPRFFFDDNIWPVLCHWCKPFIVIVHGLQGPFRTYRSVLQHHRLMLYKQHWGDWGGSGIIYFRLFINANARELSMISCQNFVVKYKKPRFLHIVKTQWLRFRCVERHHVESLKLLRNYVKLSDLKLEFSISPCLLIPLSPPMPERIARFIRTAKE